MRRRVHRRRAARIGLAVLVVAAVATTFGPWLRSGARTRTSYEVVRAADRLGVLEGTWQPAVAVTWYFLPLVAALAVVALERRRLRLGAGLALVVGGTVGMFGLVVTSAPGAADWGAHAGLGVAGALAAGALGALWIDRNERT